MTVLLMSPHGPRTPTHAPHRDLDASVGRCFLPQLTMTERSLSRDHRTL